MNTREIFEYQKTNPTLEEALDHPSFSHTRVRSWCRVEIFYVYFHCDNSPSGVVLAYSVELTEEVKKVLHERKVRANDGPSRGDIACQQGWGTVQF